MSEKHYAYKITHSSGGLACSYSEIEENKMVDLLKEIESHHSDGIFWIFKQFGTNPKEPLCIIDCPNNRIYYHYSGEIDKLKDAIKKLDH